MLTRSHTHTHIDPGIQLRAHTHARTLARTYARTNARTNARTTARTHANTHSHARTHAHTHARTHAHTHARTYTHVHKHMCSRAQAHIWCTFQPWSTHAFFASHVSWNSRRTRYIPGIEKKQQTSHSIGQSAMHRATQLGLLPFGQAPKQPFILRSANQTTIITEILKY